MLRKALIRAGKTSQNSRNVIRHFFAQLCATLKNSCGFEERKKKTELSRHAAIRGGVP
jgi:rRNA maturation protein Rpf1